MAALKQDEISSEEQDEVRRVTFSDKVRELLADRMLAHGGSETGAGGWI